MPFVPEIPAIIGLLATWPVGRLAMVAVDGGGPWVTPVVFAPAGGAVWTPIDGKRKTGGPLARLANASADPRARPCSSTSTRKTGRASGGSGSTARSGFTGSGRSRRTPVAEAIAGAPREVPPIPGGAALLRPRRPSSSSRWTAPAGGRRRKAEGPFPSAEEDSAGGAR